MQFNTVSGIHGEKMLSLLMSRGDILPLRAGEVVSAEVVSLGLNNTAFVRMKNEVFEVQSDVRLQKGETLLLRVEKQQNTVYLRLTGNEASSAPDVRSAVLSALAGFEKIKPPTEAMARLVELLADLPGPLKENLPEIDIVSRFLLQIDNLSAKTMKDVVENGGVFFETKLRVLALGMEADGPAAEVEAGRIIANDLKASLLRLKDMFLAPAVLEHVRTRVSSEELLGALNTVLRNIEFYQLQSKLTDTLQFFLPLVWRQLRDGEIIMREYDRGRTAERSYACTVHLDLERCGKVRVHLVYHEGYVHVGCGAENSAFASLLAGGADGLKQQFEEAGLRLGRLDVQHEPKIRFQRERPEGSLSITA